MVGASLRIEGQTVAFSLIDAPLAGGVLVEGGTVVGKLTRGQKGVSAHFDDGWSPHLDFDGTTVVLTWEAEGRLQRWLFERGSPDFDILREEWERESNMKIEDYSDSDD